MPMYEYVCPNCGNTEEHLRSIEERHAAPACRCSYIMELALSAPAFKIDSTFQERLNTNYEKHRAKVKAGEAKPNSLDRAGRSL